MYEYEMKVSERKAITVCMGMKCKRLSVSERKVIEARIGMKWKRLNIKLSQHVRV